MAPPQVTLVTSALRDSDAGLIATALRRDDGRVSVSSSSATLLSQLGIDVALAIERAGATGDAGEVVDLPVARPGTAVRRVLLVGTGDGGPAALRKAGAALARKALGAGRVATDTVAGCRADEVRAHVEGLLLAAYGFRAEGAAQEPRRSPVTSVDVHLPGDGSAQNGAVTAAVAAAELTSRAVHLARDLANTPSNLKDPAWLAGQAQALARRSGLTVTVRAQKQLAAEGFGGILGVGAGSVRGPRLIELSYRPARPSRGAPHVVLVGKGITFDSGGLSLKAREPMVAMKTDMAAGGAVLAVMSAVREAGVRVPVTGLVPAAENMPGASALRPGDVLTHYGGRTVEVFNTDAEGRLVLADALAYADARLAPDVLIDLATLTGAAALGLGRRHGAVYSDDDGLAAELLAAGETSGERLWRMPLVEDYRPALDSQVADLANISRDPSVSGGSIVAALFLREFVGDRRWAHLDIAGPARADADEHEVSKGGTGFGTRVLLHWLEGLR